MSNGKGIRVLVVEDDRDIALQLKKIMERRFSAEASVAYDCATARERINGERFDIVTLDYLLPDGTGVDLLEEITGAEDHPQVIMVTGRGDEETAARSLRSRASGYVLKDARLPDMLCEAVEKAITEINLRRAEEALERSEEYYRSLIENALDIIAVITLDEKISYASPSVKRVLGYGPDDMIGRNANDFFHADDFQSYRDALAKAMKGRDVAVSDEFRVKHSDGTWHFFECVGQLLPEGSEAEGVVINARDITRRKHAEETLKAYRDHLEHLVEERTSSLRDANVQLELEIAERRKAELELKKRAERLRHFLTVASHELRHPISVVKGYTTMLSGYLDRMSKEDFQGILEAIDTSTDRLNSYVDELLDVARIEGVRFPVHKEEVEIGLIVETALNEMRARGFGNDIQARGFEEIGPMTIDPDKICKLLVILLENAIKFSPPGSSVEIEAGRGEDGESVVVSVLDRGIGVPDELSEMVFNRFFQVEEVQHHSKPGIGLGLYIAKEITDAHGGRIWCEPRKGGGSAFRFTIE